MLASVPTLTRQPKRSIAVYTSARILLKSAQYLNNDKTKPWDRELIARLMARIKTLLNKIKTLISSIKITLSKGLCRAEVSVRVKIPLKTKD